MATTLYGIRNCDTMKKARAWLDARGVEYRFHDYRTEGVDEQRLRAWCAKVGWEKLVNRSGTTYRKLTDAEKASLDERRALALMQRQPSVIRRPVLEHGGRLLVGFDPAAWHDVT